MDVGGRVAAGGAVVEVKPVLFDLCCKAGGTSKGYQQAGFYVVGVDLEPQPRYIGDEFIQMDALKLLKILIAGGYVNGWCLANIAALGASPPCQGYSQLQRVTNKEYPKLIEDMRKALKATNKPYIIENVPGAPLENPVILCGSMFGLKVYRHRLFETNPYMLMPSHIPHKDKTPSAGRGLSPKGFICVTGNGGLKGVGFTKYARQAMGIEWMNRAELSQAIPPAYTRWIGERLLEAL